MAQSIDYQYAVGILSLRDGQSLLVLDDDRSPVLIATWFGPATLKNVERFYAWVVERQERAKAAGAKLALINDALDAERPGPDVRQGLAKLPVDAEVMLAAPVVLTSSLVRGALTAVGWLLGDKMRGVTTWATMDEALQAARQAFVERGLRVDAAVFTGYTRPTMATALRAAGG